MCHMMNDITPGGRLLLGYSEHVAFIRINRHQVLLVVDMMAL